MSGNSTEGRVYFERHDQILKIVIDNPAKKNAFSPEMMAQLSDAYTLLDKDNDLWVGVLCANGDNFTAGLDMPKFFGPTATSKPRPEGNIDPFGMKLVLVERLFSLTRDKLMKIPAFAWVYTKVQQAKAWLEATEAWQAIRKLSTAARNYVARLKRSGIVQFGQS